MQRNSDGRIGDGHTSYPFSSWGRSPAEGGLGAGGEQRDFGTEVVGKQTKETEKSKRSHFSKAVQLPRVRPRTGVG